MVENVAWNSSNFNWLLGFEVRNIMIKIKWLQNIFKLLPVNIISKISERSDKIYLILLCEFYITKVKFPRKCFVIGSPELETNL